MSLRLLVGAAGLAAASVVPSIAVSAASASPASATISASGAMAPSAPRTPGIASGPGRVTVSWTAPASTGGSPVLAYRVRVTPGRTVTVAAPTTSVTVTGLADGTQVTASVGAINHVGPSPTVTAGAAIPTPPIVTRAALPDGQTFEDLAVGPDGTTYVAAKSAILQMSADGTTMTPVDVGTVAPDALAVAQNGDLLWTQQAGGGGGYLVRRLHAGQVDTVAGSTDPDLGFSPPSTPVPATETKLASPLELVVSPVDGSVFMVDILCNVVERFTIGGDLGVVAGADRSCGFNQTSSGDGGPAINAYLNGPQALAIDDSGTVYVGDTSSNLVRHFTVGGIIETVAGDGTEVIEQGADLDAIATGVPWPSRMTWISGRGLLIDSLGRERILVDDRLQRMGDDAYDRALLEPPPAVTGTGAIAVNDATRSLVWNGSTLRAIIIVRDGPGLWHGTIKEVGPWLPAADPDAHPGFGSWADLVKLHHRALVDRAPTASELSTWVAALDAGTKTSGQLDDALRRSSENTTNVDPVVRLYRAFLGRAPDAAGLRYWIARKRAVPPAKTTSVGQMAAQFAGSSEFQRKYGTLSNRAFVTRIYTDVLGRAADKGGVDFWTKRLDTKRATRAQVMVNFSESSEYRRKQAANTDVAIAYLSLVNRMPTATETTAWVDAAAGGKTHIELLDDLVEAAPHLL